MKRTISMLLTFAMILTLCACGKKSGGSWQEQYDLGVRYLSEGNYEEAVIAFTAAIEIDPKRAEAFLGRGSAYIGAGETAENLAAAQADYEKALELDDTNAEAYLSLADVYIRQGEYDKAQELLRQALDRTGGDERIADKLAELENGDVTDSQGRIRRSMYYNGSGDLIGWFSYTYNGHDEGRNVRTVTAFDAAGNQTAYGENTWESTENGGKGTNYGEYVDEDSLWLQRMDFEEIYQDDGGAVEERTYYDRDGTASWRGRNYYDANYHCTRSENLDLDGNLTDFIVFEYDENGNNIRYSQYMADGSLRRYEMHIYNEQGQRVRYESYGPDGTLYWYGIDVYDDAGHRIGCEHYDADGTLTGRDVYN